MPDPGALSEDETNSVNLAAFSQPSITSEDELVGLDCHHTRVVMQSKIVNPYRKTEAESHKKLKLESPSRATKMTDMVYAVGFLSGAIGVFTSNKGKENEPAYTLEFEKDLQSDSDYASLCKIDRVAYRRDPASMAEHQWIKKKRYDGSHVEVRTPIFVRSLKKADNNTLSNRKKYGAIVADIINNAMKGRSNFPVNFQHAGDVTDSGQLLPMGDLLTVDDVFYFMLEDSDSGDASTVLQDDALLSKYFSPKEVEEAKSHSRKSMGCAMMINPTMDAAAARQMCVKEILKCHGGDFE